MQKAAERFERQDRHIVRSFYLIVSFFVLICLSMFLISQVQSYVLSSVRAYVAAEGLWSKGEKEAVFRLIVFADTGNEQDYQAFLRGIGVTLGDRQARMALQQPQPDLDRARAGFLAGGNTPADIDQLIHFFLWFHRVRYMASAIAIWTEGDANIVKLRDLGEKMHAVVRSGQADGARLQALIGQVDAVNRQLTFLENRFSSSMGKAARWSKALMQDVVFGSMGLLLVLGLFGAWRIVGGIRQTEQAQRIAAEVFQAAAEGIVVTDDTPAIQIANPAFARITGYAADEMLGKNPSMFSSGHHNAEFYRQMWARIGESGQWQGEILNRRKDGQVYPAWLSISAIRDRNQQVIQYVGVCSDITERKEREHLIWHQAHFDILTDLPNRSLFFDRLTQQLLLAKRDKSMVVLLFIDLDHFKDVNDTHGHKAGDLLLQQVAERLTANVRESDTVSRLSGDEFTVILPRIRERRDAESLVRKISANCARSYTVDGHELTVTASIGIAVYPQDADEAEALLHRADTAMYAAKQAGRSIFRFYADLDVDPSADA